MLDPTQDTPPTSANDIALFLDFDGTLVELAEAPDAIRVPVTLPELVERLAARLNGRLAIVSGRAIADLERYLRCTGIAVSGSHGLELRRPGSEAVPVQPSPIERVRGQAQALVATSAGLLLEEKPLSIAIHYRQAPDREEDVHRLMARLAEQTGHTVQHGKMVAELRPAGANKGDALRALMADPPFRGARPIFVGDDLTDEHGFEAAAALGGGGVLVGPARRSAAKWRLAGVPAVAEWLDRVASS